MKQVNIHQAKTHLSKLLAEVESGGEVVIARAGKPVARLMPYAAPAPKRRLGGLAGQIREAPGCWDPDPELERLFHDGPLLSGESPAAPASIVAEEEPK